MFNKRTGDEGCDYDNGMPDANCYFRPDSDHKGNYSSLMYSTKLDYVSRLLYGKYFSALLEEINSDKKFFMLNNLPILINNSMFLITYILQTGR